jgi:nitrate/nitrite transporter NarK
MSRPVAQGYHTLMKLRYMHGLIALKHSLMPACMHFVLQASGAHFAVVPFVSRRSYGVVSGCVGAGGSVGAIILQTIFFAGSPASPQ